jgi:hypothetical protein
MKWVVLILVIVLVAAGVGVAGFFILRRLFDRAADRVADRLGAALGELGARAASSRPGQRATARARQATGGYTRLAEYAAAQGISEDQARREFAESIERRA